MLGQSWVDGHTGTDKILMTMEHIIRQRCNHGCHHPGLRNRWVPLSCALQPKMPSRCEPHGRNSGGLTSGSAAFSARCSKRRRQPRDPELTWVAGPTRYGATSTAGRVNRHCA